MMVHIVILILHTESGTVPEQIVREGKGTSGVQRQRLRRGPGAEPLGGGQGAKPPETKAFLVLKLR